MNFLKVERARVVITPEGKELFLLSCVECPAKFHGPKHQRRCDPLRHIEKKT